MNSDVPTRAALGLAVTVVVWASAFPAIRVGVEGLGVAGLSIARLGVASASLALVAPLLGVRRPQRRDAAAILLCGAAGMSAYQLLLNWGEVHVAAGPASFLVATAPVFSVLLAGGFLGERLTPRIAAGSAIALAGVALIAVAEGGAGVSASAIAVLAAAAVQGTYHFASKPLLARYRGLEVACYAMWSGTLMLAPLVPWAIRDASAASPRALVAAAYLGLLPSALGFVTWGYAMARLSVARSTAALYLVPPVAVAVAFVWLGEVPGPAEAAGGAVAIAGVALIQQNSHLT